MAPLQSIFVVAFMRIKGNIQKLSWSNMPKRKITLNRLSCAMVCFAIVGMIETTCKKPDQGSTASQKIPVEATPRPEFGWLHDYKKAQQEATAANKFLLLDFTGSDWCGWCRKFDREILSQPQFKDYARENLVLLEVDFPRAKPQSVELRKQNLELARQYQVQGFPTIVVLNGNGEKLWQYDGYFPGGADAFVAELEKLRKG
jgi:thioredoxin-related protein